MSDALAARQRLVHQQLVRPRFREPAALVSWMGAVQAQDWPGGLWAVGARLPGAAEEDVEAAVAARAIVRTWPMRRTLHFVAAADVRWMLALLAPRVLALGGPRYRQLELDEAAFARSRKALARGLAGGGQLTRPEAYALLAEAGVSPAGQRGIHVLAHLSMEGLLCLGPRRGRQPTFVLLDEWLGAAAAVPREESLARLAARYFASHGPATARDFAWWSGLVARDARTAIAAAGSALSPDGDSWTAAGAAAAPRWRSPVASLLPPWDEYVVAYKDRGAPLGPLLGKVDALGTVGRPLVVVDGRIRGAWRRTLGKDSVRVTIEHWGAMGAADRRAVLQAVQRYGRFLGKSVKTLPFLRVDVD